MRLVTKLASRNESLREQAAQGLLLVPRWSMHLLTSVTVACLHVFISSSWLDSKLLQVRIYVLNLLLDYTHLHDKGENFPLGKTSIVSSSLKSFVIHG